MWPRDGMSLHAEKYEFSPNITLKSVGGPMASVPTKNELEKKFLKIRSVITAKNRAGMSRLLTFRLDAKVFQFIIHLQRLWNFSIYN